jgi:hypothetical protein
MTAISNDAANLTNEYPESLDETSFISAIMQGEPEEGEDAPKRKPSDKAPQEEPEQANDTDEDAEETSEETPEGDAAEAEGDEANKDEAASKKFADDGDETYVKIKVGDEEHEVKVTDLKRLWGQEASLTRKSQEVAAERTAIDAKRAENIAAYDVMLKRATERADQYRALPWTQLMKDPSVPADQLQALQAEANKALEDETFLKAELGNFMHKINEEQKAARVTSAQACINALTNPESPNHIKGWNEAVYNDLRTFGTEVGLDAEMVNNLTDPAAFKVLHMAMQFKRGASKVVTQKVNKTPTKIVKNTAASPAARGSAAQVTAKSAVSKAKKSGSLEDAANAFEALLGDD